MKNLLHSNKAYDIFIFASANVQFFIDYLYISYLLTPL
ncbi:hypothetical protein M2306_002850 [Myroides gitamensis]|uniref:Uncharacterized protein n=1 Tax=Myroides odoratus TaxID=256 RepID=A0A378RWB1_MYROD|nr:hypothetical protein Myrod_1865 [Myroides odoratus DSM 2801]EKB07683.1 hypothetical protein HMPREF9716_01722 [Myroides odoratus CIP 103059]MCS4237123.1 hypothetical protein [Myroides odoratus]MDH6602156.1 hypothetical protein [Myroides gitamensis]STZ29960.1 Uncharacterised protein [Myroides odoratus]